MNREQTKQAIEVMQAWLDGHTLEEREIESLDKDDWTAYSDNDSALFDFDHYEYRIKSDPRDFWMRSNGGCPHGLELTHKKPAISTGWIKVRLEPIFNGPPTNSPWEVLEYEEKLAK